MCGVSVKTAQEWATRQREPLQVRVDHRGVYIRPERLADWLAAEALLRAKGPRGRGSTAADVAQLDVRARCSDHARMHWSETVLADAPADVRAVMAQYVDIPKAWEQCLDGAALLWLARVLAKGDSRRLSDIQGAANEAATEIDKVHDQHWEAHHRAGNKFRSTSDPTALACLSATTRLHVASGAFPVEKWTSLRESAEHDAGKAQFDAELERVMKLAAVVIRKRIERPFPGPG